MPRTIFRLAVTGGLLTLAACGGGSSSPTGPTVPTGNGGVTADIDGQAWAATQTTVADTNGIVAVGAADASGETIGMAFQDMGTGTYDISPTSPTNFLVVVGGQGWSANAAQGSGSIKVTTLTSNHIVGTFSFNAPASGGTPTPATRVVTNGKIDVTF